MGKSKIRTDKTCLNCQHVVEKRFCGNCGQENIDTRKTFHHLFIHFFEDLTHYENSFWKTIRNLLFKPSSLSKEYLAGKRMSYLAPVRLYIFISFITFFLLAIIPSTSDDLNLNFGEVREYSEDTVTTNSDEEQKVDTLNGKVKNNEKDNFTIAKNDNGGSLKVSSAFGYKSVASFDSIQKYGSEDDKVPEFLHSYIRRSIENTQKYSAAEIKQKVAESILHNFPKVLLIYMPIFAFFLWLFHNKKRWYYFDHGIFTLHYFSFLLLISLLLFLKRTFLNLFETNVVVSIVYNLTNFAGYVWMIYYFFPAHHRFYGHSRLKSFIKSMCLLIINSILMIILFMLLFIYSFITIH